MIMHLEKRNTFFSVEAKENTYLKYNGCGVRVQYGIKTIYICTYIAILPKGKGTYMQNENPSETFSNLCAGATFVRVLKTPKNLKGIPILIALVDTL